MHLHVLVSGVWPCPSGAQADAFGFAHVPEHKSILSAVRQVRPAKVPLDVGRQLCCPVIRFAGHSPR